MKAKVNGVEADKLREDFINQQKHNTDIEKRLDLNTLLKRMKNQESEKKKINFFIISSVLSVVVVILAVLSL